MRFASVTLDQGPLYGLVEDGRLLLLPGDVQARLPTLAAAIAADALGEVADAARAGGLGLDLDGLVLDPPIPRPGKIICVGLNYRAHGDTAGRPDHPAVFTRFADTQVGHGAPLRTSPESDMLDYEGELAVVIGRPGRTIAAADALAHVAGYACYNDATMRDWQRHTPQYIPGKNFPATGGFGPWMATADAVGDPSALRLVTRVDGVVVQDAPTADMLFPVPDLIAYISRFTPLSPGDVIITGTPVGAGGSRTPPLFLRPGMRVEVEIDRIGTLANPVA